MQEFRCVFAAVSLSFELIVELKLGDEGVDAFVFFQENKKRFQ